MNKLLRKGWNGNATLTTGQSQSVPLLQAVFEEPDFYTVQFSVLPPQALVQKLVNGVPTNVVNPNPGVYQAIATLNWSVEGMQSARQLSIGNGTTISGPGQGLNISLQDQTITNGGAGLGFTYNVSATVTKGTRPTTGLPPTLPNILPTGNTFTLVASASSTIMIPQNAGVISLEVAVATGLDSALPIIEVKELQVGGLIAKIYRPSSVPTFVAVAANANEIIVSNLDAATDADITITWGIDG